MSRVRGKDTKIEVMVRKHLFSLGFRFRKNDARYPGKPDVLLPKYRTAIFVNGCFWHRHQGCKAASTPRTRQEYWTAKFERNMLNDQKNIELLNRAGWQVIVIWECELKRDFEKTMSRTVSLIKNDDQYRNTLR